MNTEVSSTCLHGTNRRGLLLLAVLLVGCYRDQTPERDVSSQQSSLVSAFPVWSARLGSAAADQINGTALDSTGAVVVAGQSNGAVDGSPNAGGMDAVVARYQPSGVKAWTRQFGTSLDDAAAGVAVGTNDSIYVGGYVRGNVDGQTSLGQQDVVIRKYDAAGTSQWTRLLGTVAGDFGTGVAFGGGGVLVAGYTQSYLPNAVRGGKLEALVAKYDENGNKLWATSFGSAQDDKALGIAADGAGNSFVVGVAGAAMPGTAGLGGKDIFVARYDATGTRVWLKQFGTAFDDSGNGISVGPDGAIYVAATVGTSSGSSDAWLMRIDATGVLQSTAVLSSGAVDEAWGVASDGSGVYVAGRTLGQLPGANAAGDSDLFLAKLDAAGAVRTIRQFSGGWTASSLAGGLGVAVANGRVVMGGYAPWGAFDGLTSLGQSDGLVLSLCNADGFVCERTGTCASNNGTCTATQQCTTATDSTVSCGCDAGFTGSVVCTDVNECRAGNGGCDAHATCANTVGSRTCTCTSGFYGNGLTCEVDVCGTGNGGCDPTATCVNLGGSTRVCSCPTGFTTAADGVTCVDVDECAVLNGGCRLDQACSNLSGGVACSCPAGLIDTGAACIPSGPAWSARLGGTNVDQLNAVAIDSAGGVIVGGQTKGAVDGQATAGGQDALVTKYAKTGTRLWTRQFGTSLDDAVAGVAVGTNDSIYAGGYVRGTVDGQTSLGQQDVVLRKYDADGISLWTRLVGTVAGDFGTAVAFGGGGVFVAGYTQSYITGSVRGGKLEALVARYDENGNKLWATSLGSTEDDKVFGLAADSAGNSYVVGVAGAAMPGNTGLGGKDIFVARYDAAGARVWLKQYGTVFDDAGNGISVGPDGSLHVAATAGTASGSSDAWLLRLDSNGAVLSTNVLSSSAVDEAWGVASDATGVYVTGRTLGQLPGANAAGDSDLFVAKFDFHGAVRTVRQFSGGWNAASLTAGLGVAVASGRVVVGGYAPWGAFDGLTSLGQSDGLVLSLCNPDGFRCERAGSCGSANGGCTATQECSPASATTVSCGCGAGFTGVTVCQDLNECRAGNGGCDALTTCTNSPGSYSCSACPTGYSGTGATGCIEQNRCLTNNGGCDVLTTCTFSAGLVTCGSCPTGYSGTGTTGCVDVDECATGNGGCDPLSLCTNTVGAHTCGTCPSGYTGDGFAGCVDVDECAVGNGSCDPLTTCTNTPGSRNCGSCPGGYTGTGTTGCVDVDECLVANGGCDVLTTCINTTGSASCSSCPSGYSGTGTLGCFDLNECATNNGGCDPLSTCTNTPGARTCGACPSGYTGTGATGCVDVDECSVNHGGCAAYQACTNTAGSRSCGCAVGSVDTGSACAGPAWTARVGGTGIDQLNATAIDSSGNVIVGGWDTQTGGPREAFIARYSATGTQQWSRQLGALGPDGVNGVAIGSNDSIFVAGTTYLGLDGQSYQGAQSDIWLAKYDAAGTRLWSRLVGTVGKDVGKAIAVRSGSVVVVGNVPDALQRNDASVTRFDENGTLLWTRSFGVGTLEDTAAGVAIDGSGNIYVCGTTTPNGIFVAKYDPSGNRLWLNTYGGTATGIALGADGALYVSGITSTDAFLLKLTTSGTVVWSKVLGSPAADDALGVAADSSSVFIVGRSQGQLPGANSGGLLNVFAARYDLNGNVITVREYSGGNSSGTAIGAGVATANGRLVLVGATSAGSFDGVTGFGVADGLILGLCTGPNFNCELPGDCSVNKGGCTASQTCTPSTSGYVLCGCAAGYTGSKVCSDVNECLVSNGGCDAVTTCTNAAGSRSCGACPAGYTGTGDTGCIDINECLTSNGGCDALTTCTNTAGSRTCGACPSGYSGTGATSCVDINECMTNNGGCDALRACTNTVGSRTCGTCPAGYTTVGATSCVDINECLTSNGGCDPLTTCTNTVGSRTCGACPAGYTGTGATGCVDINECLTSNGGCDVLSTCTNTGGSRTCGACPAGYSGTGATGCVDINECLTNNGGCDALMTCTNTGGSRICGACPAGYSNNGVKCTMPKLATNYAHSCAIDSSGALRCWGANEAGQLGDGTDSNRTTPTQVSPGALWRTVATGSAHTCGVRTNGTLWCWGSNFYGALGVSGNASLNPTPVQVGTATDWSSVTAKGPTSCGLRTSGALWCWGAFIDVNGAGVIKPLTQFAASAGRKWSSVAVGTYAQCALQDDATLWCWGWNLSHQVGVSNANLVSPTQVGSARYLSVALSSGQGGLGQYTCAVRDDHTLWCWGDNSRGQFGKPALTQTVFSTPQQVSTASWDTYSLGIAETGCGVRTDGTLWCEGKNYSGQLGTGNQTATTDFVQVGTANDWSDVIVGGRHTLARKQSGEVQGWGGNDLGQLGDGTTPANVPAQIAPGTTWSSVSVGGIGSGYGFKGVYVAGVQTGGTLWRWGYDFVPSPVAAPTALSWASAITSNTQPRSLLGIGTDASVLSESLGSIARFDSHPSAQVAFAGNSSVASTHNCAIRTNGTLSCWAANDFGELGLGSIASFIGSPTLVGARADWTAIAAGNYTMCGIAGGGLFCSGSGAYGANGRVDRTSTNVFTQVGTDTNWVSVASAYTASCGVKADHTLWCWGQGFEGELGSDNSIRPLTQFAGTDWQSVTMGYETVCALRTNGTLWCWGALQPAGPQMQTSPMELAPGSTWSAVSVISSPGFIEGVVHPDTSICGVKPNGSLWCWGANDVGQRGTGNAWKLSRTTIAIP